MEYYLIAKETGNKISHKCVGGQFSNLEEIPYPLLKYHSNLYCTLEIKL